MIIEIIYDERMKQGFTQAELARMIGVSQPYYSKVESGKTKCSIDIVEKLMLKLNLKVVHRTSEDVNKNFKF